MTKVAPGSLLDKLNKCIPIYDAINVVSADVEGNPETVQYFIGGLNGTLVSTVTIEYDELGNLATWVKT